VRDFRTHDAGSDLSAPRLHTQVGKSPANHPVPLLAGCSSHRTGGFPSNACPVVAAPFFPTPERAFFFGCSKVHRERTHIVISRQVPFRPGPLQRKTIALIRCTAKRVVGHMGGKRARVAMVLPDARRLPASLFRADECFPVRNERIRPCHRPLRQLLWPTAIRELVFHRFEARLWRCR